VGAEGAAVSVGAVGAGGSVGGGEPGGEPGGAGGAVGGKEPGGEPGSSRRLRLTVLDNITLSTSAPFCLSRSRSWLR
jgi:hypothetical protein